MKKEAKSPEQIEADRKFVAEGREILLRLTSKVPHKALNGSYQTAVTWKREAVKARSLAESKQPTRITIQSAIQNLQGYE